VIAAAPPVCSFDGIASVTDACLAVALTVMHRANYQSLLCCADNCFSVTELKLFILWP
jgi:hypothetical protein